MIAPLAGFASVTYVSIRRSSTSVSIFFFLPHCVTDRGQNEIRPHISGRREGVQSEDFPTLRSVVKSTHALMPALPSGSPGLKTAPDGAALILEPISESLTRKECGLLFSLRTHVELQHAKGE